LWEKRETFETTQQRWSSNSSSIKRVKQVRGKKKNKNWIVKTAQQQNNPLIRCIHKKLSFTHSLSLSFSQCLTLNKLWNCVISKKQGAESFHAIFVSCMMARLTASCIGRKVNFTTAFFFLFCFLACRSLFFIAEPEIILSLPPARKIMCTQNSRQ
jgi:hypothetical protein